MERDLGGLLFRLGSSEPSFLEEAAERLRAAGEHLKAAEALLLLGRVAEAKDLLADGRHYERLEQIDDMEAASASRRSRAEKAMSMAGEAAALGRREEALELSSLAAEAGMDEGALLRERLTNARPRGSVSLRPAGACAALRCLTEGVVLLGRGDQSPLRLHDPGISRQHARLSWAKRESWLLEDLGSRNGTFVGDLPIAGSLPLEAAGGRFSLGPSCRIGWRRVGEGSLLCSVERGLSAGARLLLLNGGVSLADVFPAMPEGPRLLFGDGWFVIEAGGDAFLGERELPRASRMELLRGDVLEIGGARLEVLDSS